MQKKTKSILEELDSLYQERYSHKDQRHLIESRAAHVIASAINLLEQIEKSYPRDVSENLTRKLLNSIRDRAPTKFTNTLRRTDDT